MSEEFTKEEKQGFYKAVYTRRDVRSHFTQRPIEDDVLCKLLHAAHHAPSVGFSQPWNFILVKDYETKNASKKVIVLKKIVLQHRSKNQNDQNTCLSS